MAVLKIKTKLGSMALLLLATSTCYAQTRIDNRRGSQKGSDYSRSEFIGTDISPQRCKPVGTTPNERLRDCGGVAGYRLLYSGPEEKPEVIIVTPEGKRFPITYWDLNAANFVSLSRSVDWLFIRSQKQIIPLALVFQTTTKPEEFSRFDGTYTIVAKLTPNEICTIGRVPTGPRSSADTVGLIDVARFKKCVGPDDVGEKDWMGIVMGLSDKGRFEEARSAVREIASPAGRTTAYDYLASAQAKSGDLSAPRATLLLALDEVLREPAGTVYYDAYGGEVHESEKDNELDYILETMGSIGLDNEVRTTLRFVKDSRLPETLLSIAKAQGSKYLGGSGRGDIEAAKATFKKGIELELARADKRAADSNLWRIVDAQLELRLIPEAKQTALLIKNPTVRQSAEQMIGFKAKLSSP